MNLLELQNGVNFLETLENYSLADLKIKAQEEIKQECFIFESDEIFWECFLQDSALYYNKFITLDEFVISDWVARIPGLYWMNSSKALRNDAEQHIANKNTSYTEFHPPGKSKMVMGGIGTLLFPPTYDGKSLMSASSSYNASLGIPLLVSPDVREYLNPGTLVKIKKAKWQAMEETWSKKFLSGEQIPRGYLIVDSLEKIEVLSTNLPVIYHPFSIMEYEYNDGYFYDYVYLTSDARSEGGVDIIRKFFKDYANDYGRHGEYLISSNMISPLFESRYLSPSDLNKESERANLSLLQKRIRGAHFKQISLDELIIKLPQYYSSLSSLRTLARKVGINPAQIAEGSAVDFSSQLINLCIKRENTEILIDRIMHEYNDIFN